MHSVRVRLMMEIMRNLNKIRIFVFSKTYKKNNL